MGEVVKDGKIVEEGVIEDDPVVEDEPGEDEPELDDDGKPIEKKVEPWQAVEKEEELDDVPATTHIRIKQKLKGRISDRDEEIERLKAENTQLKAQPKIKEVKPLARPKEGDFEETADYHAALDDYETKMSAKRYDVLDQQRRQTVTQEKAKENLDQAVTEHYDRAAKLTEASGISAEVYKKADQTVREAVEAVIPGHGDLISDQLISMVGEGSEKVMYYLGRNRAALNEFRGLLLEDKSGMKAAIYLGRQKERLTTPGKRVSRTPAPVNELKGDGAPSNGNERKFKRSYDAAHKKGDGQAAYNAKKAAKAAGVDTKNW